MATVEILAGDLPKQKASVSFKSGAALLYDAGGFKTSVDLVEEVDRIEEHDAESATKLSSALGWGLVGSVFAGGAGLLAGALLGGKKTRVCFAAYTSHGEKFLAITDSKTFRKIQAARF